MFMGSSKMLTMGQRSSKARALRIQIAHHSAPIPLVNLKHVDHCIHATHSNGFHMPYGGGLAMQSDPPRSPRILTDFGSPSVSTPVSAEPATCQGGTEKGSSTN